MSIYNTLTLAAACIPSNADLLCWLRCLLLCACFLSLTRPKNGNKCRKTQHLKNGGEEMKWMMGAKHK